jgi:ribonuclease HII
LRRGDLCLQEEPIGGIDEAGRGSLLGPLVIAGVAARREALEKFRQFGVRDSKKLSPLQRERLYSVIKSLSDRIELVEVSPQEIDARSKKHINLNELEVIKMAQISLALKCKTIYVDAVDTDEKRFRDELSKRVPGVFFVSEHAADEKYLVTAAASIVAKVTRDSRIHDLKKLYGEIGSGYPSDIRTINFIKDYFVRHGSLPDFARKSWKTVSRLG